MHLLEVKVAPVLLAQQPCAMLPASVLKYRPMFTIAGTGEPSPLSCEVSVIPVIGLHCVEQWSGSIGRHLSPHQLICVLAAAYLLGVAKL